MPGTAWQCSPALPLGVGQRMAAGGREHGKSAELLLGTPCAARRSGRLPGPAPAKARSAWSGLQMAANAARMRWRGEAGGPVQWECRDTKNMPQTCFYSPFLAICNCEQRPRALHPARPLGAPRADQEQPFTPPWGTCSAGAQDAEVRGARRCCAGDVLCAPWPGIARHLPGWAARRPPPRRSTLTRSTRTCTTPALLPRRPRGAQPD
jgi:hypothetical protein